MASTDFNTWNPVLHIDVVNGLISAEELRQRSLNFVYIDHDREFDTIEWLLDNRDGMLTRPEYLAAGLMVRMRMGYNDFAFPWKAFIINRVTGGLGVFGRADAAIGDDGTKITYFGRNRNAPGGRSGKGSFSRGAQAPKKASKSGKSKGPYGSSPSVTSQEMLLSHVHPVRRIPVMPPFGDGTTAWGVREIAKRNGFEGDFALIEPTDDDVQYLQVDEGMPDGTFLAKLARSSKHNFRFKIEGDVLHWHSEHWAGAKHEVCETLDFGMGPDVCKLSMDCDFQLPLPANVKSSGYSFRNRAIVGHDVAAESATGQINMALGYLYERVLNDPERKATLTRDDHIIVVTDGKKTANKKSIQHFLQRHTRAFQLNVDEIVGNPRVRAGKLLKIRGTGSPFADGTWYISEVRHTLSAETYVTAAHLKHPPKAGNLGLVAVFTGADQPTESATGAIQRSTGFIINYTPKKVKKQLRRNK